MSEYAKKNEDRSRTLSPNRRASGQRPLLDIIQTYKQDYPFPIGTIQKKPSDFKFQFPDEVASDARFKSWSKWGKIQNAVEAYSKLPDNNISERNTTLGILDTRIDEYRRSTDSKPESRIKRDPRVRFCDVELSNLILKERDELSQVGGVLTEPFAGEVSPEPEISKRIEPKQPGDFEWGMFTEDTDIVDKENTKVSRGIKGKIARRKVIGDNEGSDLNAQITKDTHVKVEKENPDEARLYYVDITPGYVLKSSLIEVNKVKLSDAFKYKATNEPLFSHPPAKEDIMQGNLGDCYLLAAMISVVKETPGHFLNHMIDNRDNTVTVKLYDDNKQPVFVKLNKSVIVKKYGRQGFAGGAMWVSLYEKAYVAAGFHGHEKQLVSDKKSYGMIEAGKPDIALKHITGKDTGFIEISADQDLFGELNTFRSNKLDELINEGDEPVLYGYVKDFFLTTSAIMQDILKKVFFDYEDFSLLFENKKTEGINHIVNGTIAYLNYENERITEAKSAKSSSAPEEVEGAVTEEIKPVPNFEALRVRTTGIVNEVITSLLRKIKDEKKITGPLGYAAYSQRERDLFDTIKTYIDGGKMLVASTKKEIYDNDGEIEGRGFSAGESIVKGLAGPHSYAVLDYAPKVETDSNTLWVKLRNPWGSVGRIYLKQNQERLDFENGEKISSGKITREMSEEADFWVDLADFAANFIRLDFTS